MGLTSNQFDAQTFRQVLGFFPTGVAVITAWSPDGPAGMAVSSFTSVSLEPPLVAFLPDRQSSSWRAIRSAGRFCVNILSADQESLCLQFARKGEDKFRDIGWKPAPTGAPILDGVIAWIDCELTQTFESGDHDIAVGHVLQLESRSDAGPPLVFFQGKYPSLQLSRGSLPSQEVGLETLRTEQFAHYRGESPHDVATDSAEAMIHEIVGGYLRASHSSSVEIMASARSGKEALEGLMGVAFDTMQDNRAAIMILQNEFRAVVERTEFAYLVDLHRDIRSAWLTSIRRGVDEGELRSDLDVDAAYALIKDIIYIAARWHTRDSEPVDPDLAQRARSYRDIVMSGMVASRSV